MEANSNNVKVTTIVLASCLAVDFHAENRFAFYLNLRCEDNGAPGTGDGFGMANNIKIISMFFLSATEIIRFCNENILFQCLENVRE